MFSLHIAVKALNDIIYEELGECESATLIPGLYDELSTKLQTTLHEADTAMPQREVVEGNTVAWEPEEPKITLVQTNVTHYESLADFEQALWLV